MPHRKCLSFHPEMRGKCWITIIRNHSFHKSLHSIRMFSFILDARAVTVTLSVFIPILSGSENSSKRTQRLAFSAAICLRHRNGVFNAPPFSFNKRLDRFFEAEHSQCVLRVYSNNSIPIMLTKSVFYNS